VAVVFLFQNRRVSGQVFSGSIVAIAVRRRLPLAWHTTATTFTAAPNLSMLLLESFPQCIKVVQLLGLVNSTTLLSYVSYSTPKTVNVC